MAGCHAPYDIIARGRQKSQTADPPAHRGFTILVLYGILETKKTKNNPLFFEADCLSFKTIIYSILYKITSC
jgi:hypothetical protein